MAFMIWDQSLSVNVGVIDEQHKKLIEMVSDFYVSLKEDKTKALGKLLDSLIDYAKYHFSFEEKYLDEFGCPDVSLHKKEHKLFIDKVLDVKKRFDEGKLVLTIEITNFLRDWIIKHVKGIDKKYIDCFNGHGLY